MKEVKYTKTHAKIQVGVSFHMRDIWKKFYLNFKSFVWRGHVGAPTLWGTNMAAGNHQKHFACRVQL